MTTPLWECVFIYLFKILPMSQLRIPTGRRQTSRLFTKRGEFASGITEEKFILSVVRVGDLNQGLPQSNPQL